MDLFMNIYIYVHFLTTHSLLLLNTPVRLIPVTDFSVLENPFAYL